jgi:hypothetical protein
MPPVKRSALGNSFHSHITILRAHVCVLFSYYQIAGVNFRLLFFAVGCSRLWHGRTLIYKIRYHSAYLQDGIKL